MILIYLLVLFRLPVSRSLGFESSQGKHILFLTITVCILVLFV